MSNPQELPLPGMPIAAIELQEYLFSETLSGVAQRALDQKSNEQSWADWSNLRRHIRQSFRLQRFAVINWLLMNGVSIPAHLLTDQAHPHVGQQMPDKSTLKQ